VPLYDYDCANCGRRFEVMHGVHADDPTSCPLCGGGPIRKAINAPAVHFKGSGWAKKERNSSARSRSATAAGDSGSSSDSGSGGSGGDGSASGDGSAKKETDAGTSSTPKVDPAPAGPKAD
jgi:putative FmdB family regulatory protein